MRNRLSVFLITLLGLILEVGLTRIYSASIWYHFAFGHFSSAFGLGTRWLCGSLAEARAPSVDEHGSAGDDAVCARDPVVFMVAGALSVRHGSAAALFSGAALTVLSGGHGAGDHLRHSSRSRGNAVLL